MRKAQYLGLAFGLATIGLFGLAVSAGAADPRCETRPWHPSCQTTTTTASSTTTEPPVTTTEDPGTTTTQPPGSTTTSTTTSPGDSVTISVVGDVGSWDQSADALATAAGSDALFVVGDLSYGGDAPEEEWCDWVKGILGATFPVEVLAGNHEADSGDSGFIRNYAECLPDRLGVDGDYGVQYSVDLGPMTFIAISPDLKIDQYTRTYAPGTGEREWLETEVAAAAARGDWIMVGTHKLCITAGGKSCQVGPELANWLVGNADVIVSGHEHTYQRTHRLACVTVDSFDETCLSEDGAIWVINGTGGRNWAVDPNDPEAPYFAALMGNKRLDDWGYGTVEFVATASSLSGTFRCGGECVYTDSFTMTR